MKGGLPKCVCSPNCKISTIYKNRNLGVNRRFSQLQLLETKSGSRHYSVIRPPAPSEMQNDEPTLFTELQTEKILNQGSQSSKIIQENKNNSHSEWEIRNGFFVSQKIRLKSYTNEFYLGSIVRNK